MALPESFEKNIKKFQNPNGLPIFLKGGPFDKVLFGVTVALCGVGIISFAHYVYTAGFVRKQDVVVSPPPKPPNLRNEIDDCEIVFVYSPV